MQTLPTPRLAALLRANAKGYYATEAATELLIGHETWLHRTDFLAECVSCWDDQHEPLGSPFWFADDNDGPDEVAAVAVHWDVIPAFLDTAPCSGSEGRILRLVAELAGFDSGVALDELLSSLDDRNSRLVVDAIAHALHLPEPYQRAQQ